MRSMINLEEDTLEIPFGAKRTKLMVWNLKQRWKRNWHSKFYTYHVRSLDTYIAPRTTVCFYII